MNTSKKEVTFVMRLLFTASILLFTHFAFPQVWNEGALVRGDTTRKEIMLVFTGHEFADGYESIRKALKERRVKASFFFTGDFYRNPAFAKAIKTLVRDHHYLGAHSDRHLLYADWEERSHTLVSKEEFITDLSANYREMARFRITSDRAKYFLPPYEWYNTDITEWTTELGFSLINYTSGTLSHADYTLPGPSFRSSDEIFNSITQREQVDGLNGYILLMHIGTVEERTDKFHLKLGALLDHLIGQGYTFVTVEEGLNRFR